MNVENKFEKLITWKDGLEWEVAFEEMRKQKELRCHNPVGSCNDLISNLN